MATKQFNQNILDYIINNYGTLDGLGDFISSNDAVNPVKYFTKNTEFNLGTVEPNDELLFIRSNNITVVTGKSRDIGSSFNIDFNIDFE